MTAKLTRIAKAVGPLPAETALFDGEAVVLLGDGHSDFEALGTTAGAARATYIAFDLLHLNNHDLRGDRLEGRREALQGLVDAADNILFSEALSAEGAVVFEGACRLGIEGIVSKRLGCPYRRGRFKDWVKVKNPDSSGVNARQAILTKRHRQLFRRDGLILRVVPKERRRSPSTCGA